MGTVHTADAFVGALEMSPPDAACFHVVSATTCIMPAHSDDAGLSAYVYQRVTAVSTFIHKAQVVRRLLLAGSRDGRVWCDPGHCDGAVPAGQLLQAHRASPPGGSPAPGGAHRSPLPRHP